MHSTRSKVLFVLAFTITFTVSFLVTCTIKAICS